MDKRSRPLHAFPGQVRLQLPHRLRIDIEPTVVDRLNEVCWRKDLGKPALNREITQRADQAFAGLPAKIVCSVLLTVPQGSLSCACVKPPGVAISMVFGSRITWMRCSTACARSSLCRSAWVASTTMPVQAASPPQSIQTIRGDHCGPLESTAQAATGRADRSREQGDIRHGGDLWIDSPIDISIAFIIAQRN